jgi:hypothetical protein
VLDGVDNCPAVSNPTQRDLDGDAIGDACDSCSLEHDPALDRDMDGITAATDLCPADADAAQTDSDGDGIGDACDPNPGAPDVRRCFSDLTVRVGAAWPIADPWKWLGTSAAYIIHQPADATPYWIAPFASGLRPSSLAVQVALTAPSIPTTNVELASGVAVGANDQNAFAACELVGMMGDTSLHLRLASSQGSLATAALSFTVKHVTLAYRVSSTGVELTCTASGTGGQQQQAIATSTALFDPAALFLTATHATAAFSAVTVYETQ